MAMSIISDSVLVESKSARDNQLESVSHEDVQNISVKVKAFYVTTWKKVKTLATQQIADCYQEVVQ